MKYFILSSLSFLFASCGDDAIQIAPPKRPTTVDSSAQWIGGKDGGYWAKIDSVLNDTTVSIKLYNDHTGAIDVDAMYTSHLGNIHLTKFDKRSIYKMFDYVSETELGIKCDSKVIRFTLK